MGKKIIEAVVSHFQIDLPFLRPEYEGLSRLGSHEKVTEGLYRWTFKTDKLGDVQNILGGKIIQYNKDNLLMDILPHCEPLMEELETSVHKKGKGTIAVAVEGEGYYVTWYQAGKPVTHLVAKSLVELIWNEVISKQPYGERIPTRDVCANIVKALELNHWNYPMFVEDKQNNYMRECIKVGKWNHARSKDFNFAYFFGKRGDYFKLFYTPIKCLKGLDWIDHTKDGTIIRLKESDDFYKGVRFDEIVMIQKECEEELCRPENPDDILQWSEGFK